MRRPAKKLRFLHSIGFSISATCWMVTLMALALYVAVNLPQQKKDLLEALRSKAQGVSSSLHEVTAGAALSEDYSTVVDHCLHVLEGDEAIDYLVITRADGFSVVIYRGGWRTETLDDFWHPVTRTPIGEIAYVPLVRKQVFRYARPFDYSGVQWGWINVGLSTAAYDRSVADVYQRSGLWAIFSAALSMFISLTQARRLVRPIVTLQGVVGEVAKGDLSARAAIHSGDEIEELGKSFNSMADTIRDRNRILESVRYAGQQLLSVEDWTGVVNDVLAKLGEAVGVSRAYLFENHVAGDGEILSSERYEWVATGVQATLEKWQNFRWADYGVAAWVTQLAAGQIVDAHFPRDSHQVPPNFDPMIRRMILTPILVNGDWWGWFGFDLCDENHSLSGAEKDSFQAVAGMLGAAIARQTAKQALLEANENLEQRVLERTSELREQVKAREEANRQLAEAQQRMMDLSRRAGMAEVATGVLHNVGNVLNSVNVSATVVANKVQESRVGNIARLAEVFQEHSSDLAQFLTHDPKGQRAVDYIAKLGVHLEQERVVMLRELEQLTGHIGHIKEIVATQQSYAKVSGLIEVLVVADLVEDAIRIVAPGLERHGIRLERDYAPLPPASVDKHSVLQILLNLLRNAKQALDDGQTQLGGRSKVVRIAIRQPSAERYQIAVSDNGVGLAPENLRQIFSHGFTTRRDGHGFGLHSGANAARQMGGSLSVESEGPGRGATFVLDLPLNPRSAGRKIAPAGAQTFEDRNSHELARQ